VQGGAASLLRASDGTTWPSNVPITLYEAVLGGQGGGYRHSMAPSSSTCRSAPAAGRIFRIAVKGMPAKGKAWGSVRYGADRTPDKDDRELEDLIAQVAAREALRSAQGLLK